jgi:hypothetical protein
MKETLERGLYKPLGCLITVRSRVRRIWINPTLLMRLDSPDPYRILGLGLWLTGFCFLAMFVLFHTAICCLDPLLCLKIHNKIPKKFLRVLDNFLDIFVIELHVKT